MLRDNAPPMTPQSNRLIELLEQLKTLFLQSGADADVTFQKLNRKLAQNVRLPFVNETVSPLLAFLLLSTFLAGPFVYLLSTCSAIRHLSKSTKDVDGVDWNFLSSWETKRICRHCLALVTSFGSIGRRDIRRYTMDHQFGPELYSGMLCRDGSNQRREGTQELS